LLRRSLLFFSRVINHCRLNGSSSHVLTATSLS